MDMHKSSDNEGYGSTEGSSDFNSLAGTSSSRPGSLVEQEQPLEEGRQSRDSDTESRNYHYSLRDPKSFLDPDTGSMLRKTPSRIKDIMNRYLTNTVFTLNELESQLPVASAPPQLTPRYRYKRQLSAVRQNLQDEIDGVLNSTHLLKKKGPVKATYRAPPSTRAPVHRPLPVHTSTRSAPEPLYIPKKPYLNPLVLPRRNTSASASVSASVSASPAPRLKRSVSLVDVSNTGAQAKPATDSNPWINPRYRFESLYSLTQAYGWEDDSNKKQSEPVAPGDTYEMYRAKFEPHYDRLESRRVYGKNFVHAGTKISTAAAKAYYQSPVSNSGRPYRPSVNGTFSPSSTYSSPAHSFRSVDHHSTPINHDTGSDHTPKSRQRLEYGGNTDNGIHRNGDASEGDEEEMGEEAKKLQDADEALVKKLMEENKAALEEESEAERQAGKNPPGGDSLKKFETIAEPHRWLGCGDHSDIVKLSADRGYLLWTRPEGELRITFTYGDTNEDFSLFIDPQFPGVKLYHVRPTGMKELILNGQEHPRRSQNPHHKDRSPGRELQENNFEFESYDGKVNVLLEALRNSKTSYKAFKINYTLAL